MTVTDTDLKPFVASVLEKPDDDGPKLVFADWLEERNDPRGEALRYVVKSVLKAVRERSFTQSRQNGGPWLLQVRRRIVELPKRQRLLLTALWYEGPVQGRGHRRRRLREIAVGTAFDLPYRRALAGLLLAACDLVTASQLCVLIRDLTETVERTLRSRQTINDDVHKATASLDWRRIPLGRGVSSWTQLAIVSANYLHRAYAGVRWQANFFDDFVTKADPTFETVAKLLRKLPPLEELPRHR